MKIPDVEAMLVGYLSADAEVIAAVGADAVSTEIPPGAAMPRIRLTLSGGDPTIPGWLHNVRVNIEAYADTKPAAFDAIAAVLERAEALTNTIQSGIVISVCEQETALAWAPDPLTELPRYIVGIILTVHPKPELILPGFGAGAFGLQPFGA